MLKDVCDYKTGFSSLTQKKIKNKKTSSSGTNISMSSSGIPTGKSIARCYADVNANMPTAYWDYDNLQVEWG